MNWRRMSHADREARSRRCTPDWSRLVFNPNANGARTAVHVQAAQLPIPRRRARDQPVICTLHRGLTRGLLDELSPTTNWEGFIPHDPDEAGCLIELRGPLADEYIDDKI